MRKQPQVLISRTSADGTTVTVSGIASEIDTILRTFNKAILNK